MLIYLNRSFLLHKTLYYFHNIFKLLDIISYAYLKSVLFGLPKG